MTDAFHFTPGTAPILISIPHAGTEIPADIEHRLTPEARTLPDTDWFVDQLYSFAPALNIGIIRAKYTRYVIDLNRPCDGTQLYPGKAGTGLVPNTNFSGTPAYLTGEAPNGPEIGNRIREYWTPYHDKLGSELARLRKQHDRVLLWDAHSIKSHVPRLFEGRLPDLNFGSADGLSCAPEYSQAMLKLAQNSCDYTHILNGRFKGGFITRNFGNPAQGIHALQLEIAQSCYMQEDPPRYDQQKASVLQTLLKSMLETLLTMLAADR